MKINCKKKIEVPGKDLYVAILDDNEKRDSLRYEWIKSFSRDYVQPLLKNVLVTRSPLNFIEFADNHKEVILFCDPGALGDTGCYAKSYKEDRLIRRWLENNPSRILHIPWLLPIENYKDITTFELEHNCNFFGTEFQWEINQILHEGLFKYNPLALFVDEFGLDDANRWYIKKLREPVLSAVCKQMGVSGRKVADRKKAINDHYLNVWKAEMKRRGVKGYL